MSRSGDVGLFSEGTLHLASGDGLAHLVSRLVGVGQRVEVIREALIDGPLPVGPDHDAWETARSRWLSGRYALDVDEALSEQQRLTELIAAAADAQDVVLWFDSDLFCMRSFLMTLHRLALHETQFEQRIRRGRLVDGVPVLNDISAASLMAASDAWHTIAAQDAAEIAAHGARLSEAGHDWLAGALRMELRWRMLRVKSRDEIASLTALFGEDGVAFPALLASWNERYGQMGLGDWQVWLLTAAAAQRGAVHVRGAEPVPASLHDGSFSMSTIYVGPDPQPSAQSESDSK